MKIFDNNYFKPGILFFYGYFYFKQLLANIYNYIAAHEYFNLRVVKLSIYLGRLRRFVCKLFVDSFNFF